MPPFSGWKNPNILNGLFDTEDGYTTLPRYVFATRDPIRYDMICIFHIG